MPGKVTDFNPDVQPFVPLVVAVEATSSSASEPTSHDYHKASLATGIQLHQLQSAKDGLNQFFKLLNEKYTHINPKIGDLGAEDKAFLRWAYKQFQPHVLAEKQLRLNAQLVSALGLGKSDSGLQILDVLSLQKTVGKALDEEISKSLQVQKDYDRQEKDAKIQELQASSIEAIGPPPKEDTLFGQVCTLKLSEKLDEYIRIGLPKVLREKLDRSVFKQLSFDKISAPAPSKDSPNVVMYKQLINSLYYLQQALAQLEKAESGYYFAERSRYMNCIFNVVCAVVKSKSTLVEASKNPALSSAVKECLQILQPLESMPLIGDYLLNAVKIPPQEQQIDIIAEWAAQLESVWRALSAEPFKPVEPVLQVPPSLTTTVVPSLPTPVSDESIIDLIAKQLFQIPYKLSSFSLEVTRPETEAVFNARILAEKKNNAQIMEFVNRYKKLSIGSDALQKILLSVTEANTQLSHIGKESRILAMGVLPATLGSAMVSAADNSEFNLGLRPGTLSEVVNEEFNTFYHMLIENLPFKRDQEALRLLTSTSLLERRLENERVRSTALFNNHDASNLETLFFGREEVSGNAQNSIGIFEKFKQYKAYTATFDRRDIQDKFLKDYQELQPFLYQIDSKYDLSTFLRRLNNADGFEAVRKEIVSLEPKFRGLVGGQARANMEKRAQCNDRQIYLSGLLRSAKLAANIQVDAFKDKVFYNYLEANVRSQVESELGPYAGVIVEKLLPAITNMHDNILMGVTIDDDIEAVIGSKIDAEKAIIIQNDPALKTAYSLYAVLNNELKKINKIDGILEEMKQYVSRGPHLHTPINQDKLAELGALQDILKSSKPASERLDEVYERGMGKRCKDILLKSSDNVFMKMVKTFWSFISGWQSKEVKAVAHFKQQLCGIKDNLPEPDIALKPENQNETRLNAVEKQSQILEEPEEEFFDTVESADERVADVESVPEAEEIPDEEPFFDAEDGTDTIRHGP